ncbi:acyl-CoA N-acyltransferases (NAT) superfamily protein [Actinidia rufa]|uniref:Acyl-CoA N-acyltransferases (NAT) superfamily protein n=1 Tax=Actinidia rufa TaxID=165716 RepID=A0A7J0F9F5_9ERIC|nr:acyl-CoA N-acyltransferases (NAT) superfamily protein [Actinidia rufa]
MTCGLQILEKKKAIDAIVKAASSPNNDQLASFPHFRCYQRNGLSVYLESGYGNKLSSPVKQYIQNLLKANMEGPYGSEWPTEEKAKRREMVAAEARYIFIHEDQNASASQATPSLEKDSACTYGINGRKSIVGFVHYRFTVEEEIPVLYVYELQLEPYVQRKGLGKFLMQLIELIAYKMTHVDVIRSSKLETMSWFVFALSGHFDIPTDPFFEPIHETTIDHPTTSDITPATLPISPALKEHIDTILDEQIISTRDGGVQRFLVRWSGRPASDDTWITSDDLQQIDRDLFEYYQSRPASHSTESSFLHPGRVGEDTESRPTITRVYSRRSKKAYPISLRLESGLPTGPDA